MNSIFLTRALVPCAALAALCACGDDDPIIAADASADATAETGADAPADGSGDAADSGGGDFADVETDADVDTATTVTFILANANPGGLSRWVQAVDARGVPAWFNVVGADAPDAYLRTSAQCTVCSCDEPDCEPCSPTPEIVELAPGDEVTFEWTGSLYELDPADFCLTSSDAPDGSYQVEFAWSPVPPSEDGTLPVGTISNTRVAFDLTPENATVRYDIERLAER